MLVIKKILKWYKMLKTFMIGELLMHVLAGNNHKEAKHFHDKSAEIDSRKYLENIYNYYLQGKLSMKEGEKLINVTN